MCYLLNSSASHEAITGWKNSYYSRIQCCTLRFFLLIKLRFKMYFHTALPLHMASEYFSQI